MARLRLGWLASLIALGPACVDGGPEPPDVASLDAEPLDGAENDTGDGLDRGDVVGTCAAAIPLEEGAWTAGDTTGATNAFGGSCTGGGAPEQVFHYVVAAPTAHLTVEVTPNPEDDFGIYIRTVCDAFFSEVRPCAENRPTGVTEVLKTRIQEGGTELFIFVDGFLSDDVGAFDVRLTETPVTVLPRGADWDAESTSEVCDDRRGDQCLSEGDGTFRCFGPALHDRCESAFDLGEEGGTEVGQLGAARNLYEAEAIGDCVGTNTSGTEVDCPPRRGVLRGRRQRGGRRRAGAPALRPRRGGADALPHRRHLRPHASAAGLGHAERRLLHPGFGRGGADADPERGRRPPHRRGRGLRRALQRHERGRGAPRR